MTDDEIAALWPTAFVMPESQRRTLLRFARAVEAETLRRAELSKPSGEALAQLEIDSAHHPVCGTPALQRPAACGLFCVWALPHRWGDIFAVWGGSKMMERVQSTHVNNCQTESHEDMEHIGMAQSSRQGTADSLVLPKVRY